MATLADALSAIQAVLLGIDGVVAAPSNPPEQINELELPAIYSYPLSGGWAYGTANGTESDNPVMWGLHTIAVNLWLVRNDLETDSAVAAQMAARIPERLMAAYLANGFNDTVVMLGFIGGNVTQPIRYEHAAFRWGGLDLLGYQFQVDLTLEMEVNE